jgi:Domain of unknown function (DUF4105)
MGRILEWILPVTMLVATALLTLWMAGAIYFDVCRGTKWGRLFALGWAIVVVAMFAAWQPLWQPFAVLLAIAAVFLGWWFLQKPSHDRDWDPSVAVLPRAVRAEDAVTIENIRNFEYRSLEDFTPHYETCRFHLANLQAMDLIFFNWGLPWMSHPVLVFDFGSDGRVCMSIEVRYRKGQDFSMLRSFYRQQELIFVAADERDVILRRTKYSLKKGTGPLPPLNTPVKIEGPERSSPLFHGQDARLYRFNASAEELRATFLDYIEAIHRLYETPRWYHGLCANCTTTFYRLPHSRVRFDWRVLANGRLDEALYDDGRLDRTLPFQELRRLASLNDIANSAPQDGFGDHIRRELERRRHER